MRRDPHAPLRIVRRRDIGNRRRSVDHRRRSDDDRRSDHNGGHNNADSHAASPPGISLMRHRRGPDQGETGDGANHAKALQNGHLRPPAINVEAI
jgi:hypothetical protein